MLQPTRSDKSDIGPPFFCELCYSRSDTSSGHFGASSSNCCFLPALLTPPLPEPFPRPPSTPVVAGGGICASLSPLPRSYRRRSPSLVPTQRLTEALRFVAEKLHWRRQNEHPAAATWDGASSSGSSISTSRSSCRTATAVKRPVEPPVNPPGRP